MSLYRKNLIATEEKLLLWHQRGMFVLRISLFFSFITLQWAILRFVTGYALLLAIFLLILISIILMIAYKGSTLLRNEDST